MRNIIIGIVGKDKEIDQITYQAITKNNMKYLHNKCSYIGLITYDNYEQADINALKLCNGIIFQGGNIIYPYHFQILEYAINNNIPVLGICMGNQLIGLYSANQDEEDLELIENHYSLKKQAHKVNFKENSYLYNIFGPQISVNSRHNYKLKEVKDPFIITGASEDNVIEAIEYIDDNHFIIGVQWHPEDLDNMSKLYDLFLKEVLLRKIKSQK